jgi:hypothetical protein
VHLQAPDRVLRTGLDLGDHGAEDRRRAQRRLSEYRVLTAPMLAWAARRRPVVTLDATLAPEDALADLVPVLDAAGAGGTVMPV